MEVKRQIKYLPTFYIILQHINTTCPTSTLERENYVHCLSVFYYRTSYIQLSITPPYHVLYSKDKHLMFSASYDVTTWASWDFIAWCPQQQYTTYQYATSHNSPPLLPWRTRLTFLLKLTFLQATRDRPRPHFLILGTKLFDANHPNPADFSIEN